MQTFPNIFVDMFWCCREIFFNTFQVTSDELRFSHNGIKINGQEMWISKE